MKKIKNKKKINPKKANRTLPSKKKLICISMAVILAAGGSVYGGTRWYLSSHTSKAMNDKASRAMQMQVQKGNLTLGTTVSGTTEAGSVYQNFLLSFLEQNAYLPVVEEVYAASGDTVEKGDALYKITEDSIAAIETYLQDLIKDAKTSYQEAQLEYASNLLEAETEYGTNKNLEGTAADDYSSTVKSLELEVESTKTEYQNAKTIISEYPEQISAKEDKIQILKTRKKKMETKESTLQTKADAAEQAESKALEEMQKAEEESTLAKNLYQNAKQYLEKIQKENQQSDTTVLEGYVEELEQQASVAAENYKKKQNIYHTAKTESETASQKLEEQQTALSETESALSSAEQKLETLESELEEAESNLDALKAAYDKAVVAQNTNGVSAKQEYESDVLTSSYASIIYESTKQSLDEDLESAKEEVETVESYLEQWKDFIGDGVITASQAGEITSIGYEADTYISSMIPLAVYYDGDILSVDVTVDQSDIGYISVGETVTVSLNGASVEGTVAAIATEKAESGASKVNYTVTVNIDNADGTYTTGQTAEMTFVKEELQDVLYVPEQMVSEDVKGSYVWIQNGDEKEKVYVQTGESNDTYIVITSGLEEGQTCVYVEEEQNETEN